jgi:uncharacterized protein (DUF58 family)
VINNYFPLLVFIILLAAIFQDDFFFTLLYLFAGAFVIGIRWSHRILRAIRFNRGFTNRAFLGEEVQVKLTISNSGWLPVPWVRIHEGLPVELSGPDSFQRVISLGPREEKSFIYNVDARRRGYYPIGPIYFSTSDILGLSTSELRREGELEHLTVYPKIVPLSNVNFPSQSPMGTLRHHRPIFEDPTRILGKRDYYAGDSLRRVDWKATAVTGKLQVKLYEPSIALETMIFLNLHKEDYHYRMRIASTELAIIIASSLANWLVRKQQKVGLVVNGNDPLSAEGNPQFIPVRSGQGHLMQILDILARIHVDDRLDFSVLFRNRRIHLPWGTTLTVITGNVDDSLFEEFHQSLRAGLSVNLILAGTVLKARDITQKASVFGIPVLNITRESDMDIWRQ